MQESQFPLFTCSVLQLLYQQRSKCLATDWLVQSITNVKCCTSSQTSPHPSPIYLWEGEGKQGSSGHNAAVTIKAKLARFPCCASLEEIEVIGCTAQCPLGFYNLHSLLFTDFMSFSSSNAFCASSFPEFFPSLYPQWFSSSPWFFSP